MHDLHDIVATAELFSRAEAYSTRLTRASELYGAAKLAVLRNIYKRMMRWSEAITDDLQARLTQLASMLHDAPEHELELRARIVIAQDQLQTALTAWTDGAAAQHNANLRKLEAVLRPTKKEPDA